MIRVNRFYVDVAGTRDDAFVVAGGYLAGQDAWAKFGKAWEAILREAKVKQFHATDFYGAQGEFAGEEWKREKDGRMIPGGPKHDLFAERFTGAARRWTACGFAFGLQARAYADVLVPHVKIMENPQGKLKAETYSVLMCLNHAAQIAMTPKSGLRAAVILENGPYMGETIELLNRLKRLGEGWTGAYLSFTTMDKSQRPLQAADLLAHESWRRVNEVANPSGKGIRKSMAALLKYENVNVAYADRSNLETSLPGLLRFLAEHPEYGRRP